MKIVKYLAIALAGLVLFVACQKEFSMESGYAGMVATGSLLDSANNCKNISVKGTYYADSTLSDSNYVLVQVNFTGGGMYKIFTDTENGFSFQDSGYIGPGQQTIKLKASGTPLLAKETLFQVAFDTTFCNFSVTVIGKTPAVYTLAGAPTQCAGASVQGTYNTGIALNATNKVSLSVSVTSVGSYNITTPTVGGMTFSGSGNFTSTGIQTITLQGSGVPTTPGTNTVPVTAGSSTCSFNVPVISSTTSNNDPNSSDSAWSFTQGSNNFNGPFYDAFDTTLNNTYDLILLGYTPATGDTTMQLGVAFSGGKIQTGTYTTNSFAAFYFTNNKDTANPVKIFTADPQTPGVNTTITIATYDTTTKIITGTYSGTALNNSTNAAVNITNGKFTAKVR